MYRFVIVDGVGSRGAGAVETGSKKPTRYIFSTTPNQKKPTTGIPTTITGRTVHESCP